LPLLKIGAAAIHVPFHTTWIHEKVSDDEASKLAYKTVLNIKDVIRLF
jgi:putative hydrolase of the HAD superfamily